MYDNFTEEMILDDLRKKIKKEMLRQRGIENELNEKRGKDDEVIRTMGSKYFHRLYIQSLEVDTLDELQNVIVKMKVNTRQLKDKSIFNTLNEMSAPLPSRRGKKGKQNNFKTENDRGFHKVTTDINDTVKAVAREQGMTKVEFFNRELQKYIDGEKVLPEKDMTPKDKNIEFSQSKANQLKAIYKDKGYNTVTDILEAIIFDITD